VEAQTTVLREQLDTEIEELKRSIELEKQRAQSLAQDRAQMALNRMADANGEPGRNRRKAASEK